MPLSPRIALDFAGRFLPAGDFLLPVCTNRDRALALISALNYAVATRPDEPDFAEILTDIYNAIYYANTPNEAPCNDCSGTAEPGNCYEFTPAIFDIIYPNNPYNGELTGPAPLWYISPALSLIGAPEGALTTDPAQLPGFPSDLPVLTLYTNAAATIEFHFHTVLAGGLGFIRVDDDILTTQFVPLQADITAVPPQTPGPLILEVTVDSDPHKIEITLGPWFTFSADNLFLPTYGGALTKVVVCTEDIMGIFRQPEFRFTAECGLEVSYDNGEVWTAVPGWSEYAAECFEGPPGAPGAEGPPGAPGSDCDCPEPGEGLPPDSPGGYEVPALPVDNTRCEVAYAVAGAALNQFRLAMIATTEAIVTEAKTKDEFAEEVLFNARYLAGGFGASSAVGQFHVAIAFAGALFGYGSAGLANRIEAFFLALDALSSAELAADANDPDVLDDYACAMYNLMVTAGETFPSPATWVLWIDYVLFNNPGSEGNFNTQFWEFLAQFYAGYFSILSVLPDPIPDDDRDCEPCRRTCPLEIDAADPADATFYAQADAIDFEGIANPYAFANTELFALVTNGWQSSGGDGIGVNACASPAAIRNSFTGVAVVAEFDTERCISSIHYNVSSNTGLWGGGWWYFIIAEGDDGIRRVYATATVGGTGGSATGNFQFDGLSGRAAAFPARKIWIASVMRTNGSSPGTVASRCARFDKINGLPA